ncbi:cornifin-a-like [Plakobranchus ocellatus]|uniref:Cornifin-a-like n=1 Tax=Plakobranchus ocellatus TaxID=259542 RepID=A0AAV4BC75_9GAST|nr:cornifin-a-like [Plakobranchus ocellatus]
MSPVFSQSKGKTILEATRLVKADKTDCVSQFTVLTTNLSPLVTWFSEEGSLGDRKPTSLEQILCKASSQQGDLRLSGIPSGQAAGGGARNRDRRVAADLRTDPLATVRPTPQFPLARIIFEYQEALDNRDYKGQNLCASSHKVQTHTDAARNNIYKKKARAPGRTRAHDRGFHADLRPHSLATVPPTPQVHGASSRRTTTKQKTSNNATKETEKSITMQLQRQRSLSQCNCRDREVCHNSTAETEKSVTMQLQRQRSLSQCKCRDREVCHDATAETEKSVTTQLQRQRSLSQCNCRDREVCHNATAETAKSVTLQLQRQRSLSQCNCRDREVCHNATAETEKSVTMPR